MTGSKTVLGVVSVTAAVALAACTGSPAAPDVAPARATVAAPAGEEGGVLTASGRGDGPIVWVINQQLFFDSIITADPLPPHGKFQLLRMDGPGPNGLQTMWGPGDQMYRGGRWWVDVNDNGEMDPDEDHFFSCPLLGPGRANP